jgi:hypothetical protein
VNTRYLERLANFAALVALGMVVIAAVIATWTWFGQDFIAFYTSTRLVLLGENPYDYVRTVPMVLQTIGVGGNSAFYYPLWFTFPLLPLATIPFQAARLLWIVLGLVSAFIAMGLFARLLGDDSPTWTRWLVWLYCFCVFGWLTLRTEQVAFLLLLDLALTLWAIQHGHRNIAAVALGLLFLKINVTFLPVFAIGLNVWRTQKRILFGAVLTLAVLFVIGTLVTPNWWSPILAGRLPNGLTQGLRGFETDGRRLTTTMADFLLMNWGVPEIFSWAGQIMLLISVSALILYWRGSLMYSTLVATACGFLITPYAVQYDYPLLAPAFIWVALHLQAANLGRRIFFVLGAAFMASVLFWEGPVSDALWIAITMAFLLLLNAPPLQKAISNEQVAHAK